MIDTCGTVPYLYAIANIRKNMKTTTYLVIKNKQNGAFMLNFVSLLHSFIDIFVAVWVN